jgi:hypothetical protein
MVKPPLRTKSIGFKVSQEEYSQLEKAARSLGARWSVLQRNRVIIRATVWGRFVTAWGILACGKTTVIFG